MAKQKSRLVLGKSKGEFETTLQYEDRLRREEQTSIEINNEYNQKIKLATENWEIEQFKSQLHTCLTRHPTRRLWMRSIHGTTDTNDQIPTPDEFDPPS